MILDDPGNRDFGAWDLYMALVDASLRPDDIVKQWDSSRPECLHQPALDL